MSEWWQLTDSDRLYLECAVSAIVKRYDAEPYRIARLIRHARHLTYSPLVRAVIWRLGQELS